MDISNESGCSTDKREALRVLNNLQAPDTLAIRTIPCDIARFVRRTGRGATLAQGSLLVYKVLGMETRVPIRGCRQMS